MNIEMLYELDPVKSLSVFAAMCERPAKTVVCYQSWLLWMICIHLGLLGACEKSSLATFS